MSSPDPIPAHPPPAAQVWLCKTCERNLTPSPTKICGECSPLRPAARRPRTAWRPPPRTSPGTSDISDEINRHAPLVLSVFRELRKRSHYIRRVYRPESYERESLLQAGREGLAEALKDHKPEKGKLSTIAYPIIRRRMWAEVQRHRMDAVGNERRNDGPESDRDVFRAELRHYAGSDDEFIGRRAPDETEDPASTQKARKAEEAMHAGMARLRALLPRLPSGERLAVERRFGLAGEDQKSPLEIGKTLGVSEATARQLIEQGIRRLHALAEEE